MKKCPTCENTFEDSMRFCQIDGTPLVDDAPAFDPYATIVAQPKPPVEEVSVETPVSEQVESPSTEKTAGEPVNHQTVGSMPIAAPDDVLDLPEADPLKTMYVSDAEMRAAIGGDGAETEPEIVEIPPLETTSEPQKSVSIEPELPSFAVPDVPAPLIGDVAPPPSPFSVPFDVPPPSVAETPVLSEPAVAELVPDEPSGFPEFDEAATIMQPSFTAPAFNPPPPAPVAEWSPPPPPEPAWQGQAIGQNTPFQPPAVVGGQNKTLAIVSLVCGILSLICCSWFIPGIAAIVMGFIARGKAKENPAEYGGEGLALGGMITGAISIVFGIIVIILYFLGALAGTIGNF